MNRSRKIGLTATALLACTAVQAGVGPDKLVLTAYSNVQGGPQLLSGAYMAALEDLGPRGNPVSRDPTSISNNLCVAYTVTHQWETARAACDKAVKTAVQERLNAPSYMVWSRKSQDEYIAVALSNRAILHWLSAEPAAAHGDMQRAAALSPRAEFVTRNLTALKLTEHAVAQVEIRRQP
ncbi:MAG TPA: hypothetical protein VMT29_02655 [Steroidobacteraceae bacterium]|nr:hypothetical protein [Steroidobacteraceae bacterium]